MSELLRLTTPGTSVLLFLSKVTMDFCFEILVSNVLVAINTTLIEVTQ